MKLNTYSLHQNWRNKSRFGRKVIDFYLSLFLQCKWHEMRRLWQPDAVQTMHDYPANYILHTRLRQGWSMYHHLNTKRKHLNESWKVVKYGGLEHFQRMWWVNLLHCDFLNLYYVLNLMPLFSIPEFLKRTDAIFKSNDDSWDYIFLA